MKLATRLSIVYSVLFLLIINLFGVFMIHSAFSEEMTNAVYEANDQAASMTNVLSVPPAPEETAADEDVLSDRLHAFRGGLSAMTRGAELRTADGKTVLATSLRREIRIPEDLNVEPGLLEHRVQTYNGSRKELLVVGKFDYNHLYYTLVYTTDVTYIFTDRQAYIRNLLIFDAIGGLLAVLAILLISKSITRPLSRLTAQADRIAGGDYSSDLPEESKITEIRDLSRSVSVMQGQIEERIASLEEKNAEQKRFIDALTHEIRTPLTSIVGYSSLLLPQAGDETMARGLTQIHSAGLRIQGLTESLIRLLTLDKEPIETEEVDLAAFLQNTAETYALRLEEDGIGLSIEGSGTAVTDPGLLSILLSNVIDNAIKAMAETSEKRLTLSCASGLITVSDTGKGIPEEDLQKIFEPFFMVDKSRKHSYGGFGLGLAICARIRDVLGLTLDISSSVSEGTTVTVRF